MLLMNQHPISGVVELEEFNYYLYEVSCDDCGVVINLATFSTGDPDLYISYGDHRLPSKDHYDIKSATLKSEILTLDLNHDFYKSNKIKSMKGPYIIGVYGTKRSSYTLTVSEESHPISVIVEGMSVKSTQEPFDIQYYMFYNFREEKDFKIILNVKAGLADIYVSTMEDDEHNEDANQGDLTKSLPKSKRDAMWVLEHIDPMTSTGARELLILNQETNYCSKCYFLIGIVTHEKKTDYTLLLHSLDANYENSMLLKLGEVH